MLEIRGSVGISDDRSRIIEGAGIAQSAAERGQPLHSGSRSADKSGHSRCSARDPGSGDKVRIVNRDTVVIAAA
jgi:hypothetical protein